MRSPFVESNIPEMETDFAPAKMYEEIIRRSPFLTVPVEGELEDELAYKGDENVTSTEMDDVYETDNDEEVDFPEGDQENENDSNDDETGIADQWPAGKYEVEDGTSEPVELNPVAVPKNDPVPFAPLPSTGSFWPLITNHPIGKKREVPFCGTNGKCKYPGRRFLASRDGGKRYHVGIDLWANHMDPVVACEDGKIINSYSFHHGTWAIIIEHENVVINYGEVEPHSLDAFNLKPGDMVKAGQQIGRIGKMFQSSMLHFEIYRKGTLKNKRFRPGQTAPKEILNPTKYLLFLQRHGLQGKVIGTSFQTPTTPQIPDRPRTRAILLNRKFGQTLGWNQSIDLINDLLIRATGQPRISLDEDAFAKAVATWQRLQGNFGRNVDGIIGPRTWEDMKPFVIDMKRTKGNPASELYSGPEDENFSEPLDPSDELFVEEEGDKSDDFSNTEQGDADFFDASLTTPGSNLTDIEYQTAAAVVPVAYGGFDLQLGDSDAVGKYGGITSVPGNYIGQLQADLRSLGFNYIPAVGHGIFDINLQLAVREFQIHAKMPMVSQQILFTAAGVFSDKFSSSGIPNTTQYSGRISGVVNFQTRQILQTWLRNNWRCPVIIEAWNLRAGARHSIFANGDNLWKFNDITSTAPRMFARDFSGYYTFPPTKNPLDRNTLGTYAHSALGGPLSKPPSHTWREGEILPDEAIFPGVNMAVPVVVRLNSAQLSTYKVIRAVSEVECLGYYDSINAYDNVFLSIGTYHMPVGAINWSDGGELGALLSYFREANPMAYENFFGIFGIRAVKTWNGDGNSLFNTDGFRRFSSKLALEDDTGTFVPLRTFTDIQMRDIRLKGAINETRSAYNWFKSWHWFYRFAMAARTSPDFKKAIWDYARIRLRELLNTHWDGTMTVRDVESGMQRFATIGDFYTSEKAVALVLRWHVRFPSNIVRRGVAGQHLRNAIRKAHIRLGGDPLGWTMPNENNLIQGIIDEIDDTIRTASTSRTRDLYTGLKTTMTNVSNWPGWGPPHPNRYAYRLDPVIGALSTIRTMNAPFPLDQTGLSPSPQPPRVWVP